MLISEGFYRSNNYYLDEMESENFIAKDKYFAAVGARVARNPEDAHVDEFIKLVPGIYPSLVSSHTAKLSKVKLFWLQSDNTGGKFSVNNNFRFCSRISREI